MMNLVGELEHWLILFLLLFSKENEVRMRWMKRI